MTTPVAATAAIETGVLNVLFELPEGYCYNLRHLSEALGVHREYIRAACHALRERRLVTYQRGIWTEDGRPAGTGYMLTEAGVKALAAAEELGELV